MSATPDIQTYLDQVTQQHWLNQAKQSDDKRAVEVLVPIYNGLVAVDACIKSLLKHTNHDIKITLLNDASTDVHIKPLLDDFAQTHRHIEVIHRSHNLGYLHNINQQLQHCQTDVVLLNADTQVTVGWLHELQQIAVDPSVGAVCPLSDHATILSLVPADAEQVDQLAQFSGWWYPIPTAVGFCLLIKAEVHQKLGGFDPYYHPGYGEENDYSMQIRKMGQHVACAPAAFVYHQGSVSFQQQASQLQQQHEKLLSLRWPHYNQEVQRFSATNPIQFIKQRTHVSDTSKERVLHVVHGIDSKGGVELFTRELLERFDHQIDHTLLVPHRFKNQQLVQQLPDHITVITLDSQLSQADHIIFNHPADPYHRTLDEHFKHRLTAGAYDLVHFHSLVGVGTAMWPLICARLGIPFQLFFHDHYGLCQIHSLSTTHNQQEIHCGKSALQVDSPSCQSCVADKLQKSKLTHPSLLQLRSAIWQQSINSANHIYFPSQYLKDLYQQNHPAIANKSSVVSPCFYPPKTTSVKPIDGPLTIAFLGQFGILKGAQFFLDIYQQLQHLNINWKIIGGIDPKYLAQLKNTRIETAGAYHRNDLASHLASVDVVLFTAQIAETYSLTLSEAWSHGVPVIAPDLGAYTERVHHAVNGYLYSANQLSSATQIIERLFKHKPPHTAITQISFTNESAPDIMAIQHRYHLACQLQTSKPSSKQQPSHLPQPRSANTDYMQSWLSAPRTMEAEGDWVAPPEYVSVKVLGCEHPLRQQTLQSLSQQNCQAIELTQTTTPSEQVLLIIQAGHQVNENLGNWIKQFISSQAAIGTADYALIDHHQQLYAPQFQGRFSPHNHQHLFHHLGCCLINVQPLNEHQWSLIQQSNGDIHSVFDLLRKTHRVHHFPYLSYTAPDLQWVSAWKAYINQPPIDQKPKNNQVLIVMESNKDPEKLRQRICQQDLFEHYDVTLTCIDHNRRQQAWANTLKQSYHWYLFLNDNVFFTVPNYLSDMLSALHNSALEVLSIPTITTLSGHQVQAQKSGGANHFFAPGVIRDTRFDHPKTAFECDLPDEDCMLFSQHAWQHAQPLLAHNNDYYLSLWLARTLKKSDCAMGIFPGQGVHKQGLPTGNLHRPMASLAQQRKQVIKAANHLLDTSLYPAAFSCRKTSELDLNFPTFKTPKRLPRVVAYAPDDWSSGYYRIKSPLTALAANNHISAHFLPSDARITATPGELNRMQADVLLLHHYYADEQLAALIQYKKQLNLKTVISTDDLLTHMPAYNNYQSHIPEDIETRIKLACSMADTVVVSSDALANQMSQFHNNIRVIPNRLIRAAWPEHQPTASAAGSKLRVGWAGAGQHRDDLDWLKPIIEQTQAFCQWVFFGDHPKGLQSQQFEFHQPVALHQYPEYLNNLNLDVAIAPLVDNPFNHAKSNLKLIEYGALGLAVIASDIQAYQNSPACLLVNQSELWIEQLQQFNQHRSTLQQHRLAMHQWVSQHYWLDDYLDQWLSVLGLD